MKAKPFPKTSVPNLDGKRPEDTITRREAVALIASRVPFKRDDDERTVRNRVSTAIYDAEKASSLVRVGLRSFRLGDLAVWTKTRFPECQIFTPPFFANTARADLRPPGRYLLTASAFTHPTTLPQAIEMIIALRAKFAETSSALAAALIRIEELESDAIAWRRWNLNKSGKRQR